MGFGITAFTQERSTKTILMLIPSIYTAALGLLSVVTSRRTSNIFSLHLATILLCTFGVFIYRDIWPLAKINGTPQDSSGGGLLWAQIAILGIASVVIPLTMPRHHVPLNKRFDPGIFEKSRAHPAPEQTCSLFSLLLWSVLDPVIYSAYKNGRVAHDDLPPLVDSDDAQHLAETSLPHLDPISGTKRHLFWGLMAVYCKDFVVIAIMMTFQVLTALASPFGINKLLRYIENGGENATVKPWMRIVVRTESLITQLVFNHSLRVRIKAETTLDDGDVLNAKIAVVDLPEVALLGAGISGPNIEDAENVFDESPMVSPENGITKPEGVIDSENSKAGENLVGKINNLCTSDLGNIFGARDFLLLFLKFPLQLALSVWLLYSILGWSAIVGLVVMVALFPIPGGVSKLMQGVQVNAMKKTDARVQTVTETMNVLRMVKLFGWEKKMNERISEKREDELHYIWKQRILEVCTTNINMIIPVSCMIVTYATYTLVMKQDLTASKIFASISVFDMLKDQFHIVFGLIPRLVQGNLFSEVMSQSLTSWEGKVSVDRINDFLQHTDLLDCYAVTPITTTSPKIQDPHIDVGFRNATFSCTTFQQAHILQYAFLGKGALHLLLKNLGFSILLSRITSFLDLLGMKIVTKMVQLPCFICGLERDLELFHAGDSTEVGEKGLTLSGGQKARITLARAIYSSAEILLLDDIFAALDVHTAKHIVDKCFSGKLVHGRTVILVTHNIPLITPIASFVVTLGVDGSVLNQGSPADVLGSLAPNVIERGHEKPIDGGSSGDVNRGKLVMPEDIQEGHVGWKAFRLFLDSLGGSRPILFWIVFVGGMFSMYFLNTVQTWWLGYWASKYSPGSTQTVPAAYYLSVYAGLVLLALVITSIAVLVFMLGSIRASRIIHSKLIQSVLGTTLRWLDQTPSSRVITRCTQDMRTVDDDIAHDFAVVLELSLSMMIKLIAVIALTPIFILPSAVIAVLGVGVGHIYIQAQLPFKREMSVSKSPVLAHFGAAIAGLVSVRAYGAQAAFSNDLLVRINRYTRAARTYYNLNRWIRIRIDTICAVFTASLATYLVYGGSSAASASDTGFSLNMTVGFAYTLLWWVGYLNALEVEGTSLERILEYITVEQEALKPEDSIQPPAYWPASGDIRVENLSAKYSPEGPWVLRNISFHLKPGEHIGIEGDVRYDGVLTSSLAVEKLRSSVTVIPQIVRDPQVPHHHVFLRAQLQPELLKGSVRENLDPFNEHDDATLNDSLRAAGLVALQSEMTEGKVTLDSPLADGGGNLSVGQRQILALARALVRNNKVVILDEATSAIDYRTDSIIQRSLRTELGRDVTLITVAHRLQTIMDSDRIIVLDAGQIVEFDSPKKLLEKSGSLFSKMVQESDDRELLVEMAQEKI
ncbi:hypothetical protein HWV62_14938 [Athelia sp. TMB]|nr:hypothetical protein HWV62_14938 [Athelia sp. TMB]